MKHETLIWRVFDTASDICLSGAKCEIDIDECDSAPCQNGGLCKDGMGDFQCQCKPGFLGERVDVHKDLKVLTSEWRFRECYLTWKIWSAHVMSLLSGENQILNFSCAKSFCFSLTSMQLLFSQKYCISPLCFIFYLTLTFFPFASGSLCEAEVNECVSSPCLNEGVCVDEVNRFTCSCAGGFTG